MPRMAHVVNGEILDIRDWEPLPTDIKKIAGVPVLRPVRTVMPAGYNERFHELQAPTYEIKDTEVVETFTAALKSAEDILEARTADVDALRDDRMVNEFVYQGKPIRLGSEDVPRVIAAASLAQLCLISGDSALWPEDFAWIADDNSQIPLPYPQDMLDLATEAFEWQRRQIFAARAIKDQLIAMAEVGNLQGVIDHDITQGW